MIVESINIGLPKKELFHGKRVTTGIGKKPVSGSVNLTRLGFEGDGVADLKHHGGPDKAVCVYSLDHYKYWEEILGTKLPPAAFGENLTVSELREKVICIGDIFKIGKAVVQISQPRQPCGTLAARFGRKDMVKKVIVSGFTGFYFRVLEAGLVETGTSLTIKERDPRRITVAFANQTFHHDKKNREAIESILSVPALSESWQQDLRKFLAKL
jgi:MOSC domain-containing protein YiiM